MIRIAAIIFLSLVCLHPLSAADIFFDDFNDGNAEDGNPVTWVPVAGFPGTFDASSGDYHLSPSQWAIVSTVPEHIVNDVSIRMQARILEPSSPGGGVEVIARANRANVTAYLAGLNQEGTAYIRNSDIPGTFVEVNTDLRPLEEDVIMQFDVFGTSLSMWAWPANEPMLTAPLLTTNDSAYTEGEVGIDYFSSPEPGPLLGNAIFRYFQAANSHIVPEPSALVLATLGVMVFGLRRLAAKRRLGLTQRFRT